MPILNRFIVGQAINDYGMATGSFGIVGEGIRNQKDVSMAVWIVSGFWIPFLVVACPAQFEFERAAFGLPAAP
jgi:hypothetical protein